MVRGSAQIGHLGVGFAFLEVGTLPAILLMKELVWFLVVGKSEFLA